MKKFLKHILFSTSVAAATIYSPALLASCGEKAVWYNMLDTYAPIDQYEPTESEKSSSVTPTYVTSLYKSQCTSNKKIFESDFLSWLNNKIKPDTSYSESTIHIGNPIISKNSDVLSFTYNYKFKQTKTTPSGINTYDMQITASFSSIKINTFIYENNKWYFSIDRNYRNWPSYSSLAITAKGKAEISGSEFYDLNESFSLNRNVTSLTTNQTFVVNEMYDRDMIICFYSDYLSKLSYKPDFQKNKIFNLNSI